MIYRFFFYLGNPTKSLEASHYNRNFINSRIQNFTAKTTIKMTLECHELHHHEY